MALLDKDLFSYDFVAGKWMNKTLAGAGVAAAIHAPRHTDGTDDIQAATDLVKGLLTAAAQIIGGLKTFKGTDGIKIQGTGVNTNTMQLKPGVAGSVDRLDFLALRANKRIGFQLHPNGTSNGSQFALTNAASQTHFGALLFFLDNVTAKVEAQLVGAGPRPTMLQFDNWESVRFGDSGGGDYSEFEADGTLKFVGAATVWEDIRVPVSSIKRLGFSDPDWVQFADDGAGSTGVYALAFDDTIDEEVYFACQIPHSYKEGTDIVPHIHWAPSDGNAGNVTWKLEYTWANIDGTYGNTATAVVTDSTDATSHKHLRADLTTIAGAGKTMSSILMCRLYRDVSDADTYGSDAFLLEFDFHIEMDTVGSRAILTK